MIYGKIFPFLKHAGSGQDILLTGIPRSGTTLACRLLSNYAQTIALNEPMEKDLFETIEGARGNIRKCFSSFRKSLLNDGTALARTAEGEITDNAFSQTGTKRERVVERTVVKYDKPLEKDFTLVLKHCAEFTLLLPGLAKEYPVYAVVRNPLALLASWASVDVPVSRGKVAKSAKLNPAFHEALSKQGDELLKRQLFILSWYFGQYNGFDPARLIRYEDLVESPADVLRPLAKGDSLPSSSRLQNKNTSPLYDKNKMQIMSEALMRSAGHYWNYYTRESVQELMEKMTAHE
jgi:hypothetical protein